jgi:hypothetical protein
MNTPEVDKALDKIQAICETIKPDEHQSEYRGAILELLYSIALEELLDSRHMISVSSAITFANELIDDSEPEQCHYRMALTDFILELS